MSVEEASVQTAETPRTPLNEALPDAAETAGHPLAATETPPPPAEPAPEPPVSPELGSLRQRIGFLEQTVAHLEAERDYLRKLVEAELEDRRALLSLLLGRGHAWRDADEFAEGEPFLGLLGYPVRAGRRTSRVVLVVIILLLLIVAQIVLLFLSDGYVLG